MYYDNNIINEIFQKKTVSIYCDTKSKINDLNSYTKKTQANRSFSLRIDFCKKL